jgi:integrase/recombinase XerC
MTTQQSAPSAADVDAARLLLAWLGVSPADLMATPEERPPAPTFADYIPVVRAAVTDGTRRVYGSYWNRIVEHWGTRRLDEPTPSEIQQLAEHTKTPCRHPAKRPRRTQRRRTSHRRTALHLRHAENDRHLTAAENPARKVAKPRRLPSDRRAVPGDRLDEINHVAATTGSDPSLDTLILRLHTETACRRGGALALRPCDLDPEQCLIRLREKGETIRWQPVSPTLITHLQHHAEQRGAPANGQLLRYATGRPITSRRYDHLWVRIGRHVPWVATQQISTHWLRHTTLTWVERNFGYAVARAYAGHTDSGNAGTTATYVRASPAEIATALAALTAEPHPLALGESRHRSGGDTR